MNTVRAAAIFIATAIVPLASAQDHGDGDGHHVDMIGPIQISHAFMAMPEPGAPAVVFFEIDNEGIGDRLLSASSPFAGNAEISGFTLIAGRASWQPVGAVDVPSGAFTFDPGGLGIVLQDIAPLPAVGGYIDLQLVFERAGQGMVEVELLPAGTMEHPHAGHDH